MKFGLKIILLDRFSILFNMFVFVESFSRIFFFAVSCQPPKLRK